MRSKYIIFVPGLFGWGPGELGGFPYWGDALQQFTGFKTHETKCGPISSFHDRACEVLALIKGTKVHYGLEHSAVAGHALFCPALIGDSPKTGSIEKSITLMPRSVGSNQLNRERRRALPI